jgi:hypothetical protein
MFQYVIFGTMFKWRRGKKQVKKMRHPTGATPDANGRADKNDHFNVYGATQTDARGQ